MSSKYDPRQYLNADKITKPVPAPKGGGTGGHGSRHMMLVLIVVLVVGLCIIVFLPIRYRAGAILGLAGIMAMAGPLWKIFGGSKQKNHYQGILDSLPPEAEDAPTTDDEKTEP